MRNKDFREIQVSSSLLVVIFLGVLALGVFIFLLGVNVGKNQVRIAARTQVVTEPIPEPVKDPAPVGLPEEQAATAKRETSPKVSPGGAKAATAQPRTETKTAPPATGSGLYYVQVAAFTERPPAAALADKYRKQGYTAIVTEPRPGESRTWYRVRLGGYSSRDRAVDLLNKLNAAETKNTDYRVVQD
jgi:cell division septation protein DedD